MLIIFLITFLTSIRFLSDILILKNFINSIFLHHLNMNILQKDTYFYYLEKCFRSDLFFPQLFQTEKIPYFFKKKSHP